ncbi:glycosyltransferase family 2 protein [Exiguobacterium sp. s142]|uniref:glycosyltransferase family 2 protein n=1 Tax=Exiguobacterium sp. s142 TaxID=2751222 RepID=UPI001BEA5EEA|nr:glycosyltransferase family 2 protein [Exiguobacterium sp. s142]
MNEKVLCSKVDSLPLVSVIVATYRRDSTLKRAINSILKQSYKTIEIIIIDDNNDSEWSARVSGIINLFNDKRIILKKNPLNLGSAKSRNEGIMISSGEYITFLDDDDEYSELKIEHQLLEMRMKNSDFSITDLSLYNHKGNLIEKRTHTNIENYTSSSKKLLSYHMMHHLTGTDCLMFKKGYLLEIGMFPLKDIGDEFYLVSQAIKFGGKFQYIPRCNVKAYVHSKDVSLSVGDERLKGEKELYKYKRQHFSELNHFEKKYIQMRHYLVVGYVCIKRKSYFKGSLSIFKAVYTNPLGVTKIALGRIRK